MILYLSIIVVANFLVAGGVSLCAHTSFFYALLMTALATVIVILIDGLTATVCRLLPKKCADERLKMYAVSKKEKKFYEKLKIRQWKDKVPEIGHFTGFRKNKIAEPNSVEYLDRFLLEICYGELGHFCSVFTSFLLLLFFPVYAYWIAIAIPVAFVSAVLNVVSVLILRYNSYKLRVLRANVLKKQERAEKALEDKIA